MVRQKTIFMAEYIIRWDILCIHIWLIKPVVAESGQPMMSSTFSARSWLDETQIMFVFYNFLILVEIDLLPDT